MLKGRWPVSLVVLVLVGVACTGSGDRGDDTAASQSFTVEVDGKADGFSAGFPAFFLALLRLAGAEHLARLAGSLSRSGFTVGITQTKTCVFSQAHRDE